jgi:carboxyl-terminal processing protease
VKGWLLILAWIALLGAAPVADVEALAPTDYRQDARSIEGIVNAHYAYLDRFTGTHMPVSPALRAEAERVQDRRSLLHFAERMLLALADHHAITGSSTRESWAVVPSYSDLWVERRGQDYVVEAVRHGSPAEAAGIRPGDGILAFGTVPAEQAVKGFWDDLGLRYDEERAGFAARVLAAGRRNAQRQMVIVRGGQPRPVILASLYSIGKADRPLVETYRQGRSLVVRINDSLGDDGTIRAFDAAMASAKPRQPIILDLTDTPSGGNTVVARGLMGWFVDVARPYQVHNLPAEARRTGVSRQWVEQVLPRPGKRHRGPLTVRVGRWTGSMGEGLAIGFDALGAKVVGTRMAGLLGAIYDFRLERSGLVIKLPAERLLAVDGTPRERFVPKSVGKGR